MSSLPRVGAPRDDTGTTGAPAVPSNAARRVFAVGGALLIALPALLLLLTVPSNAVLARGDAGPLATLAEISSQGWAFFTKSPREPEVAVYRWEGNAWERRSAVSNAEPRFLLGADRTVRTEYYEVEALLQGSTQAGWTTCESEKVTRCLPDDPTPEVSVTSRVEEHRFCGTLALVRREPVPWAWADSVEEMPADTRVIEVSCATFTRGSRP